LAGRASGGPARLGQDASDRPAAVPGADAAGARAGALRAFYERYLGLKRSDAGPPHAVVFDTKPIAFAVRDVVPVVELDAIAPPGQGMALCLHAPDAQDIHDAVAAGTTIVSAPVDGPFGRTFTFADPDGYQVTLHDRG
jgi:predicted enzyme related to lactoylglutathione lyase